MTVRNYRDLLVWQKAIEFVECVYQLSRVFPAEERFALRSQLRRSAVSVPSNIAEGEGRFSKQEFRRFLSIAMGSLREAETQIEIAVRLKYCSADLATNSRLLAEEVGRLIRGLERTLARNQET